MTTLATTKEWLDTSEDEATKKLLDAFLEETDSEHLRAKCEEGFRYWLSSTWTATGVWSFYRTRSWSRTLRLKYILALSSRRGGGGGRPSNHQGIRPRSSSRGEAWADRGGEGSRKGESTRSVEGLQAKECNYWIPCKSQNYYYGWNPPQQPPRGIHDLSLAFMTWEAKWKHMLLMLVFLILFQLSE